MVIGVIATAQEILNDCNSKDLKAKNALVILPRPTSHNGIAPVSLEISFEILKDLPISQIKKLHASFSNIRRQQELQGFASPSPCNTAVNSHPKEAGCKDDEILPILEFSQFNSPCFTFNYTKKKQAVDSIEYAKAMKELNIEVLA